MASYLEKALAVYAIIQSDAAAPLPEFEHAPLLVPETKPQTEAAACEAPLEVEESVSIHDDEDVIELDWTEIVPCPTCGSLEKWWSMTGQERCLNCDYPSRAMYFLQRASQGNEQTSRDSTEYGKFRGM